MNATNNPLYILKQLLIIFMNVMNNHYGMLGKNSLIKNKHEF